MLSLTMLQGHTAKKADGRNHAMADFFHRHFAPKRRNPIEAKAFQRRAFVFRGFG